MESKLSNKLRMAKYYLKNRERILVRNKEWQKKHRKRHRFLISRWHKENYARKYAISKLWEKANPDKRREIHRRWCKSNPDKCVAMSAKRRTLKSKAGGSFTSEEFKALCKKYNNKCLCCDKHRKLTADHVIPVSKGGSSSIGNIQPLCKSCNSTKSTKVIDYRNPNLKETVTTQSEENQ